MSTPFVAEIRIFAFNFAPTGWALCNGQIMSIAQNTALFSLLGTTYGGNGQTTFGLPDLQGSVPIHQGQGQGLSLYQLGQTGGSETETLLISEIPLHTHTARASNTDGLFPAPTNNSWAAPGADVDLFWYDAVPSGAPVQMSPLALSLAGGSLPHNNLMPYLTLNFCIALQGVFPARN
jgi:microcystin-dependent protein